MSIVTGLRNASFPAEYILLPGTRLCYPFLVDAMSSSMYMLGTDLSVSLWLPGIVMMALTFLGYACLVWRIGHKAWMVVLCTLLLFVNGGFGFFDMFDMVLRDPVAVHQHIHRLLPDADQSARSEPALEQHTGGHAGAAAHVPGRLDGADAGAVPAAGARRAASGGWSSWRPGLLAGCMLMINTHAFLALGLASAGFMFWQLWQATREVKRPAHARTRRAPGGASCW